MLDESGANQEGCVGISYGRRETAWTSNTDLSCTPPVS
jgi:hypothetical protein